MKRNLALVALAAPLLAQLPPASRPQAARPATAAKPQPSAPAPKAASILSPKDLKFPPLRAIPVPKIDAFTMANGMKVFLMEDHEFPVVAGTALVRTGNLFDPPDKVGLATLTGMVMRTGGAKTRSGEDLDLLLDNIAASVESAIGETSATVNFSAMKDTAPEVVEAFRDVLTAPEFRQDKIDAAKTQLRWDVAKRNDDTQMLALREFTEIVYGKDTPYGWRAEYATLNRIVRGDLEAFHHRYFFPANVILAVRGDFVANEMKSRLEALFADWNAQQPAVPEFPKAATREAPGTFLAAKRDTPRTFLWIGHIGGAFNDKDYPALQIAMALLGSGSQSRLFEQVRSKTRLPAELLAVWDAQFDHPGLLRIGGSTPSGVTIETITAILDELDRVRTGEITDEELRVAKDAALNRLVFASDTRAKTLDRVIHYAYHGYPADFLEQTQKALAAVTKADVQRVLRDRLDPQRFTIVVAGNPLDFGQRLEAIGKPVSAIDLRIAQPRLEVSKFDDNSLQKGQELLARAQEAVGGVDNLLAVKDLAQTFELKTSAAAGSLQVTEKDSWITPSYFRQESQTAKQGRIAIFLDGKIGRIATPRGSGVLTGTQLRQVRGDLFRLYIPLLLSNRMEGRTVNAVDENTVEISDANGNIARLVLDEADGMPSRILYDALAASDVQVSVEDILSDFREVAGIKMPHAITIMQSGQKFADVTVLDVKVNKGLKVEELRRLP